MKRTFVILLVLAALGGGWYWWSTPRAASSEPAAMDGGERSADAAQTAAVRVVVLQETLMAPVIVAYGTVIAAPDGAQNIALPFDARIRSVGATKGQCVAAGDILLELEPSADACAQMAMARSALTTATALLTHVRQLYDLRLATNDDLLKAQREQRDAALGVTAFERIGLDSAGALRAPRAGVVSMAGAQPGAVVPANTALLAITCATQLDVCVGIELEDMALVRAGQTVTIAPVNRSTRTCVISRIRLIGRSVDEATGLVDVFAPVQASDDIVLGDSVKVEIAGPQKMALTVPRTAVLPDGDAQILFTVRNGHAIRHVVQTGIESGGMVEITGGDVARGDQAVILGNYELADGMAVTVEPTL